MNDIKSQLDDATFKILYADDLQTYVQVQLNQLTEDINLLSSAAQKVSAWAELNLLTLNAKKTVFVTSHTVGLFKILGITDILMNDKGNTASFVDNVLSLGVVLDSTLLWKQQVLQVTKKENRVLFGLQFIKLCASMLLRRMLVESLITPHTDYGALVYADMSLELCSQLQRLADTGIRYIFGARRDEHITPSRNKLKWVSNNSRRDYFGMLLMYRIVRMKEPPLLLPYIKRYITDKPVRGPRREL